MQSNINTNWVFLVVTSDTARTSKLFINSVQQATNTRDTEDFVDIKDKYKAIIGNN